MSDEATQKLSQDYAADRDGRSIVPEGEDFLFKLTAVSGWDQQWLVPSPEEKSVGGSRGEWVSWSFGRGTKAQYHFPPDRKRLSGVHFRIFWQVGSSPPQLAIQDVSTNGTFLNNLRLPSGGQRYMLAPCDRITVGMGVVTDEIQLEVGIPNWDRGDKGGGVRDMYAIGELIGHGAFATVRKGMNRQTGEMVALKIISKNKLGSKVGAAVQREIDILTRLRHPHIVCLHEILQDDLHYYLVMDLVEHGDLMDYVQQMHEQGQMGLNDSICREIMRQTLEALAYMHAQGISHRDLKPDNILVESVEPVRVKVADFGLAKLSNQGTFLKTFCGTLSYLAPEVLSKRNLSGLSGVTPSQRVTANPYTHKVDMWSLGCVAYVLLTGCMPFSGETQEQLVDVVSTGHYHQSPLGAVHASSLAREFVSKLLDVNPETRLEAIDALALPWVRPLPVRARHGLSLSLSPPTAVSGLGEPSLIFDGGESADSGYSSLEGNGSRLNPGSQDYQRGVDDHHTDFIGDRKEGSDGIMEESRKSISGAMKNENRNVEPIEPQSSIRHYFGDMRLDGRDDGEFGDSDLDNDSMRLAADTQASQRRLAEPSAAADIDPRDYGDSVVDNELYEGTWAVLITQPNSIPFKDVTLTKSEVVFGRDGRVCDVVWPEQRISRRQLKLSRCPASPESSNAGDQLWAENLSEINPCYIANNVLMPHERMRVFNGDIVTPGVFQVTPPSNLQESKTPKPLALGLFFRLELQPSAGMDTSLRPSERKQKKIQVHKDEQQQQQRNPAKRGHVEEAAVEPVKKRIHVASFSS